MPGAGKSTIVSKLKEQGYETFSLGDGVRAEAKKQNLEPTGENLGKLMLELREKNGPGAIAKLIQNPIQNSTHKIIIIDGIRSIHEINVLKEIGNVKLLAVKASSDTRFVFLSERKRSDDPLTREKFELLFFDSLFNPFLKNFDCRIYHLFNCHIIIFNGFISKFNYFL